MRMHGSGAAHIRCLQYRRPEQRVKVQYVLADEMMQFGARIGREKVIEAQAAARA